MDSKVRQRRKRTGGGAALGAVLVNAATPIGVAVVAGFGAAVGWLGVRGRDGRR